MRWDQLFADLDARFDELEATQAAAELADRERVAVGAVLLTQRLAGAIDQVIRLRLTGAPMITGILRSVGPDFLLLTEGQGSDSIVALAAITSVEGLRAATGPVLDGLALRFDLRRALRGVARDRSPVTIAVAGQGAGMSDGGTVTGAGSAEIVGTIDRVGADFVEVAVHAAWEPRRAGSVRTVALVPLAAIVLVRAMPLG